MMGFNNYLVIYIALFLMSLTFLLTRCYVRLKINKAFHAEDWFAVAAVGIMFIETVLSALFTKDFMVITELLKDVQKLLAQMGTGQFQRFLKHMLEIQTGSYLAFMISLWCIKFSFLLFYRRLSSGLPVSKFWVATMMVCTLALIGNIVGFFFACIPLSTYWDGTCNTTQVYRNNATLWAFTATDILTDILVMIIPLRLLRHLRISRNQKFGLCFLFCLGFAVITMSVVRSVRVEGINGGTLDPKWVAVWSMAEQTTAMIVCCLPAIRKLFSVGVEKHGHRLFSPRGFNPSSFPKWSFMSKASQSPSEKHQVNRNIYGVDEKNVLNGVAPDHPSALEAGLTGTFRPTKSPELPPRVMDVRQPAIGRRPMVASRIAGLTSSQEELNSTISSTDEFYKNSITTIRTRTASHDTASTNDRKLVF